MKQKSAALAEMRRPRVHPIYPLCMHVRVVLVPLSFGIGRDGCELTREVFGTHNAMRVVTVLPNGTDVLFTNSKGKATFD